MVKSSYLRLALLFVLFITCGIQRAEDAGISAYQIRTIVLDAGHGGHDSGCHGPSGSYEKTVTLKVVLALGKLIEEQFPNIKVIYTRKTDVFITLQDRALTANKNNADVFISVHCNANANKAAYGVETFLMGMHVADENLDVAKRENAVIKLEDNYEQNYGGFDPDSPEWAIAISLEQSANIVQSSYLAGRVQEQITKKLNRYSRGVKQAGFWVLYRTTCPSILIETGFLTNKEEEKFLISEEGQQQLAHSIFDAFVEYKDAVEKGGKLVSPVITAETPDEPEPDQPDNSVTQPVSEDGIVYKVQLKASSQKLQKTDKVYQVGGNIQYEFVNGMYKYLSGPYRSFDDAGVFLKKARTAGYSDAFVAVYKDGKRLPLAEAKQYLK